MTLTRQTNIPKWSNQRDTRIFCNIGKTRPETLGKLRFWGNKWNNNTTSEHEKTLTLKKTQQHNSYNTNKQKCPSLDVNSFGEMKFSNNTVESRVRYSGRNKTNQELTFCSQNFLCSLADKQTVDNEVQSSHARKCSVMFAEWKGQKMSALFKMQHWNLRNL